MSIRASRSGATARVLEDLAATESLAAAIAARSERGDVITLAGDLGTGKTTFARFFIHARGVRGEVPSPTFTLVQLYAARGRRFGTSTSTASPASRKRSSSASRRRSRRVSA